MSKLEEVLNKGKQAIKEAETLDGLAEIRNQYLSKKGEVSALLVQLKDLPNEKKREFGQQVNQVKDELNQTYQEKLDELSQAARAAALQQDKINIELPGVDFGLAHLHPLTIVQQEIEDPVPENSGSVWPRPEAADLRGRRNLWLQAAKRNFRP